MFILHEIIFFLYLFFFKVAAKDFCAIVICIYVMFVCYSLSRVLNFVLYRNNSQLTGVITCIVLLQILLVVNVQKIIHDLVKKLFANCHVLIFVVFHLSGHGNYYYLHRLLRNLFN